MAEATPVEDSLFDKCYQQLLIHVKDFDLNERTLILFLKYAMEIVEVTKLKGSEQKALALKLLRKLVETLEDEAVKNLCLTLIDSGAISQAIDVIVDASKGKLHINHEYLLLAKGCCGC